MRSDIRYIVDEDGNRKEVIVPMNIWSRLLKKSKSNGSNKTMTRKKLRKFQDTISLTTDPLAFQRKMRDEWK